MNNRNPTTLNALLVSEDLTPRPSGSRAVIVEIQADDGTLLLPRLTRIMLSSIQYATSSDVSFGVNGMLAYDLEGDQLVVFSQGHWKTILTQDLDLPPPLTLVPDQMNGELPEAYAIAAGEAGSDLQPVPPVTENASDQTGSLMTPVTNESTTNGSRYAVAQPVTESVTTPVTAPVTAPVSESLTKSLTDVTSQIHEMTEEEELAALTSQKEALQTELAAIQNSISTLQTMGG